MVTNLAEFKVRKTEQNFRDKVYNKRKTTNETTYHEHDLSISIEASLRKDETFNEHDWHVTGNNNKIETLVLLYMTYRLLEKDLKTNLGESEFKEQYINTMKKWFRKSGEKK